jgi:hypothetical protein
MLIFKPLFQLIEFKCSTCGYKTNSIFNALKHQLVKKPDISDKIKNIGKRFIFTERYGDKVECEIIDVVFTCEQVYGIKYYNIIPNYRKNNTRWKINNLLNNIYKKLFKIEDKYVANYKINRTVQIGKELWTDILKCDTVDELLASQ